jgi:hypothetical protein
LEAEEGQALMIKKTLLVPNLETGEDWLRTNIVFTNCSIGGRMCILIIDGGEVVVKMWYLKRW